MTHLDCKILEVAEHLYREVHGVSMLAQEVAVMLRQDRLSKTEADELLARDPNPRALEESIAALCARVDMEPGDFPSLVTELRNNPPAKFDSR